ncbi:MAG: DUF3574 domain-containing protein [Phenylobacterium sp.]|uniref:DUF3574 domain-containing protein n=1 Tax=Phenylobacterium sp. TaxID=1871053 RepID=UPI0025F8E2D3|nr:DUF3574 domain-containing protein [Phenylobacterium sp.]MBI1199729.1 DUF3574 domain-containing protein [Phenylobacterium sp.]
MKRLAAAIVLSLAAAACASAPPRLAACPAGQSEVRVAQLFLGASSSGRISERALRRFVDQEITPRFPDGVSIVDGGPQWTGKDDVLIRESAKVVLIALPSAGDARAEVEAVRAAYRSRFRLDSFLVMPPPSCMAV